MKASTVAAYGLWLAAGAFLMRLEVRSDDAGAIAASIMILTFFLGCLHPRRAWQWALLVGPCVPAADLLFGASRASAHPAKDVALLAGFVILLGLAGSYAGVLARTVGEAG